MNWLTDYVKPTLKSLIGQKRDVPEDLWTKCDACHQMLFQKDLPKTYHICRHCGYHMRLGGRQRLTYLFDKGHFETLTLPTVKQDPLKFKDQKKYTERLKIAQQQTGEKEAILVAEGCIQGKKAVVAAFDFFFMGGSMGMQVGQGLITGAHHALKNKLPYIVVPASGGARMQEGVLALMEMPRSIIAIQAVKEARLPYIVVLTNPTTGGVSASFAMIGDITIAEPKATVCFTGARVIKETIQEELPEGFQTAEYLYAHGQIDMIVHRDRLSETLGKILMALSKHTAN